MCNRLVAFIFKSQDVIGIDQSCDVKRNPTLVKLSLPDATQERQLQCDLLNGGFTYGLSLTMMLTSISNIADFIDSQAWAEDPVESSAAKGYTDLRGGSVQTLVLLNYCVQGPGPRCSLIAQGISAVYETRFRLLPASVGNLFYGRSSWLWPYNLPM